MIKQIYLLTVALLLTLVSCNEQSKESMTVIKDCTGTYLRMNETDYFVCNYELLASHTEGEIISVTFKETDCENASEVVTCMMHHPYESKIEIIKIK